MNSFLTAFVILSGLLLVIGVWLGWQLLRQNGRILLRLDDLEKRFDEMEFGDDDPSKGLPVGTEAPAFGLPDLAGAQRTLAEFRGQPALLIFFHPECGYCRKLVPQLATLSGDALPRLLIIAEGDAEKIRELFDEHKLTCPVLLQKGDEVAKAYEAHGTPMGYLISADGKIASALAAGAEPIVALASQPPPPLVQGDSQANGEANHADRFSKRSLTRSKIKRDGLKAGTPAPDFRLPRLDGRGEISLSELRGKRVLLVFSDPQCGPCQELAPQLEALHRKHREIELVMISRGEPGENRAKVREHGLTFTVALQRQWEISRRYAMFATPVAYLINERGVIAQSGALGAEPILALAQNATTLSENIAAVN